MFCKLCNFWSYFYNGKQLTISDQLLALIHGDITQGSNLTNNILDFARSHRKRQSATVNKSESRKKTVTSKVKKTTALTLLQHKERMLEKGKSEPNYQKISENLSGKFKGNIFSYYFSR